MTDRDTAGARWFREEKERRAREAAEQDRLRRQKALDALARARSAAERARQASFEPGPSASDEERALLDRILAESDPRARERIEAALKALRERRRRTGTMRG